MRALWYVLILLFLAAFAPCAEAFQFMTNSDGRPLFWPKAAMPVPYVIPVAGTPDVPGSEEFAAIQASFNAWQEATRGEITFLYAGTTPLPAASNDGLNTACYWVQWDWALLSGGFGHNVIALTFVFWDETTGEILEADILCNDEFFQWGVAGEPGKMDVQNVMTHEVGHFLGLSEEPSVPEATMFPTIGLAETHKRILSQDDILGARTIYPNAAVSFTTRLYDVVLSRAPDPVGLSSWVNFLEITADFPAAAKGFLLSPEFLALADNNDFVTTLYRTILFREPDPEGFAVNLGLVDAGRISLEELINAFLNSEEFTFFQPFP